MMLGPAGVFVASADTRNRSQSFWRGVRLIFSSIRKNTRVILDSGNFNFTEWTKRHQLLYIHISKSVYNNKERGKKENKKQEKQNITQFNVLQP